MKLPVSHTTSSAFNEIRHVNFITILKEKIVKTKIRQSQFPLFSLVCFPAYFYLTLNRCSGKVKGSLKWRVENGKISYLNCQSTGPDFTVA
jgi:hypothetical protein